MGCLFYSVKEDIRSLAGDLLDSINLLFTKSEILLFTQILHN